MAESKLRIQVTPNDCQSDWACWLRCIWCLWLVHNQASSIPSQVKNSGFGNIVFVRINNLLIFPLMKRKEGRGTREDRIQRNESQKQWGDSRKTHTIDKWIVSPFWDRAQEPERENAKAWTISIFRNFSWKIYRASVHGLESTKYLVPVVQI